MNRGQSSGRAKTPGSRMYLQDLVNDNPEYLNQLILSSSTELAQYTISDPKWVSPLVKENYKEYRDDDFLWPINQASLYKKLHDFWPSIGPQWVALAIVEGKAGDNGVILAEAKANIPELGEPNYACRAIRSRNKIENSLVIIKQALGVNPDTDWMGDYYQYANRLAYLYFLLEICHVPTWMVFIYFIGGDKKSAITDVVGWQDSIASIRRNLGLPKKHILSDRIINVFPRVSRTPK